MGGERDKDRSLGWGALPVQGSGRDIHLRQVGHRLGHRLNVAPHLLRQIERLDRRDGQRQRLGSGFADDAYLKAGARLLPTADEVWAKVKPMVTDPARQRRTDRGNPEICNIFSYHKIFSDEATIAKVDAGCRSAGIGCIECKKWMFEGMEKVLAPVRDKRRQVVESGVSVRDILADGTRRAREVAGAKMAEVRDAVRI